MALRPVAEIRDPVHGYVKLTQVERELVDSEFVQRLRRVHQLAGSYLVYPGAVHTRFEHVVGAMHVAGQIGESLVTSSEIGEDRVQELRIAALLHDVGHGPFSHMYEEVLTVKTSKTHEDISQMIIRETAIADILERHGYSARKMSALAVGKLMGAPPYMNEVISGGLSADIMDYLPRDSYFTGVEYGKVDVQRVIDSLTVVGGHLALDEAAVYAFEALLLARYEMFKAVYFHRTVRAAELMLVRSMRLADDVVGLTDLSDLEAYLELTDEVVIHKLVNLDPKDPRLAEARRLAEDFRNRRLVKCVFEKLVQRKDRAVKQLFAKEAVRARTTAELARSAGTSPDHIYLDVPTTPSVPYTSKSEALADVRLTKTAGGRTVASTVPLDKFPIVGSIAGFMDMLRVYTTARDRGAVELAAQKLFRGRSLVSGQSE